MLLKKTEKGAVYLVQKKAMTHCYKLYLKHCVADNSTGKFREVYSRCIKDDIYYETPEAAREAVKVLGNVYVKKLSWDTIKEPRASSLIYFLTQLAK